MRRGTAAGATIAVAEFVGSVVDAGVSLTQFDAWRPRQTPL